MSHTVPKNKPVGQVRVRKSFFLTLLVLIVGAGLLVPKALARCDNYLSQRQPFFGDLHVHTRYSLDASTQDTRTTPQQAYAFAQGEKIGIQPWAADGSALRSLQLERPLDFAAVTDHAELLGEVHLCESPSTKGYDSWQCFLFRAWPRAAFFLFNTRASLAGRLGFCGEEGEYCRQAGRGPWQEIIAAAQQANDDGQCNFSAFIAYEWTGASANLANLHRNIVFRNDVVPSLPISFIDAPSAEALWDALDRECTTAAGDCDVLVIPHNSNLSDGFMFQETREDGRPLDPETIRQRARLERLAEMMQHKGSSECYFGPLGGEDELCGFEQLPYARFKDKFLGKILPFASRDVSPEAGFLRDVLGRGLAIENSLNVNPFQFGFIGSTDTHIGTPGAVSESNFPGHGGAGAVVGETLSPGFPDDLEYNPGGLAAVWAEENSREAIFAALKRREAYATSGPRIKLRFFGGKDLPSSMCDADNYAEIGYGNGVAMGAEMPNRGLAESDTPPTFSVFAQSDPDSAHRLERIQIIKGSVSSTGKRTERIYDIAGRQDNTVPANCEASDAGAGQLCATWQDPDFQADDNSYYYARVLETPRCRWSQHICVNAGVDCSAPETVPEALSGCCSAHHRPYIRERAWSSPIWIQPLKQGVESAGFTSSAARGSDPSQ